MGEVARVQDNNLQKIVENKLALRPKKKFAAIIGLNPSNGARSPGLWNTAYLKHKIDVEMISLDVAPKNLEKLLNFLEKDSDFIGGAIAMPYKELVAKWLKNRISPEAYKIGAVNVLYRDYTSNNLYGTNSDGEASLKVFEERIGSVFKKNFLLLGSGGVAKAVAVYFSNRLKQCKGSTLSIVSRRKIEKEVLENLGVDINLSYNQLNSVLMHTNVVINCTSVGFGNEDTRSLLSEQQLRLLPKNSVIYDVIYQPLYTPLLKAAKKIPLQILNGSYMNIEQAVLGFIYANPLLNNKKSIEITRHAMRNYVSLL